MSLGKLEVRLNLRNFILRNRFLYMVRISSSIDVELCTKKTQPQILDLHYSLHLSTSTDAIEDVNATVEIQSNLLIAFCGHLHQEITCL